MAHMHAKVRNALPDSDFALVVTIHGKKVRKYPDNNLAHGRDALSRAAAIGGATEAKVDRKVYAKYPALKQRHDARK